MSDTELKHLLIRDYLRELSAACVTLPAAQARELREQITAHLDEALPPDATAEEVQAELVRLGRPRSLAAEAAGPGWQPVARRLRNWLGHVRWWVWVALVLVVSMVATGAGLLISMRTAAPLQQASTFGWYFPQDQGHDVETTVEATPRRTPSRSGTARSRDSSSTSATTATGPRPSSAPTSPSRAFTRSATGLLRSPSAPTRRSISAAWTTRSTGPPPAASHRIRSGRCA